MGIRTSKNGNRIQMTGGHANGFVANIMVDSDGARAHWKTCGPARESILAVMKERGITPEEEPKKNEDTTGTHA